MRAGVAAKAQHASRGKRRGSILENSDQDNVTTSAKRVRTAPKRRARAELLYTSDDVEDSEYDDRDKGRRRVRRRGATANALRRYGACTTVRLSRPQARALTSPAEAPPATSVAQGSKDPIPRTLCGNYSRRTFPLEVTINESYPLFYRQFHVPVFDAVSGGSSFPSVPFNKFYAAHMLTLICSAIQEDDIAGGTHATEEEESRSVPPGPGVRTNAPRSVFDLYTPRWVKGRGPSKVCEPTVAFLHFPCTTFAALLYRARRPQILMT